MDEEYRALLLQWEGLLRRIFEPNTTVLKEATEVIKEKLQNPDTIIILIHLVCFSLYFIQI